MFFRVKEDLEADCPKVKFQLSELPSLATVLGRRAISQILAICRADGEQVLHLEERDINPLQARKRAPRFSAPVRSAG